MLFRSQAALPSQIRQGTGHIPDGAYVVDLFSGILHPAGRILGNGLIQAFVAAAGIVEPGNGLHQQANVEIRQLGLKFSEGLARKPTMIFAGILFPLSVSLNFHTAEKPYHIFLL